MAKRRRRELFFNSMDEIRSELDRLAGVPVETSGNFDFAQIVEHLARSLDVISGHLPVITINFPTRVLARMTLPWVLRGPLPSGFRLNRTMQSLLWTSDFVLVPTAMLHFDEALERYRNAHRLPPHPYFGDLTRPQHDRLQCLHCAMHLSFVHPVS